MSFEHPQELESNEPRLAEQQDRFEGDHWILKNNLREVEAATQEFAKRLVDAGWTEDEMGIFENVVGEVLANAVIHGNLDIKKKEGQSKQEFDEEVQRSIADLESRGENTARVILDYKFKKQKNERGVEKDGVEVVVSDEGKSKFDPDTLPDPTSPEGLRGTTGRGVRMIIDGSDGVDFSNGKVTLWKFKRTGYEVE